MVHRLTVKKETGKDQKRIDCRREQRIYDDDMLASASIQIKHANERMNDIVSGRKKKKTIPD
jgi:hypothetical protein